MHIIGEQKITIRPESKTSYALKELFPNDGNLITQFENLRRKFKVEPRLYRNSLMNVSMRIQLKITNKMESINCAIKKIEKDEFSKSKCLSTTPEDNEDYKNLKRIMGLLKATQKVLNIA